MRSAARMAEDFFALVIGKSDMPAEFASRRPLGTDLMMGSGLLLAASNAA